jgi:hypothetical protein
VVLRDSRPRSYQRIAGRRVGVESSYVRAGSRSRYGFELGSSYDPRRPLVIDSGLAYSTFLGGAGEDGGGGIAADSSGSAYMTGVTDSTDFPTTAGAFDATHNHRGHPSGTPTFRLLTSKAR